MKKLLILPLLLSFNSMAEITSKDNCISSSDMIAFHTILDESNGKKSYKKLYSVSCSKYTSGWSCSGVKVTADKKDNKFGIFDVSSMIGLKVLHTGGPLSVLRHGRYTFNFNSKTGQISGSIFGSVYTLSGQCSKSFYIPKDA